MGVRADIGAIPFQALGGLPHHQGIPHMVPSILVPVTASQGLLSWLAGDGILLVGTLIGWMLAAIVIARGS